MTLWEIATGKEIRTFSVQHKDFGSSSVSFAFSPDGSILSAAEYVGMGKGSWEIIELWDVKTGKKRHILNGHWDSINSVAFNPKGQILASGSDDNTIKLWALPLKLASP